jgi:class 3 adenylate cyclase
LVQGTQWAALGLPQRTSLRIALHAGPVYEIVDAVTGRPGFAGTHISRAARIEPVTPPGQVYVSEAFAALLALDDAHREFFCEYLGSVPLAKDYGRLRTYRLNWRVPTAVMSTA